MKKNTKKTIISLFIITILFGFLFLSSPLSIKAQDGDPPAPPTNLSGAEGYLDLAGTGIGYNTETNEQVFIGNIIQAVLSLVGIFFLILVIIGGFQWMTAGGNEETVTKAKKRVMNATMGLAIVLLAYAISYFIIYKLSVLTI